MKSKKKITTKKEKLTKYKLYYFPVMRKGLAPTLVIEFAGLKWDGAGSLGINLLQDWPKYKPTSPFGQIPLLIYNEKKKEKYISQSTAVVNYIARKAGLAFEGKDFDYGVSQMLIAEGEDLHSLLAKYVPTIKAKLGEDGKSSDIKVYKNFWKSILSEHLFKLEKLLIQGRNKKSFRQICGTKKYPWLIGEIYLFAFIHQLMLVNKLCLKKYPNLHYWYTNLLSQSIVQHALNGKSPHGIFKQYFIKP
jgi:glutathione S-transferase